MSGINERACTDTDTCPPAPSCCVVTDHLGMSLRTHFQPDITMVPRGTRRGRRLQCRAAKRLRRRPG